MSGSGISWAICKSAPRIRQTTTPVSHQSFFYRPDALPVALPTASKHWSPVKIITKTILTVVIFPMVISSAIGLIANIHHFQIIAVLNSAINIAHCLILCDFSFTYLMHECEKAGQLSIFSYWILMYYLYAEVIMYSRRCFKDHNSHLLFRQQIW